MRKSLLALALLALGSVAWNIPPRDNTIYVKLQEYNVFTVDKDDNLPKIQMIYWDGCNCDGKEHLKLRAWRKYHNDLFPGKENGKFVAEFVDVEGRRKLKRIVSDEFRMRRTYYDPTYAGYVTRYWESHHPEKRKGI